MLNMRTRTSKIALGCMLDTLSYIWRAFLDGIMTMLRVCFVNGLSITITRERRSGARALALAAAL